MHLEVSAGFTRYCILARAAIVAVLLMLGMVIGWFYFVGPIVLTIKSQMQGLGPYLLGSLAVWHPTLLFMLALWFMQGAAGNIKKQGAAGNVLTRNLSLAGWLLMAGALAVATSKPLLVGSSWFARHLVAQNLQYTVWAARQFDNYVAAAVIGLVGLLLVLLSKILRDHTAAAEELRQIF